MDMRCIASIIVLFVIAMPCAAINESVPFTSIVFNDSSEGNDYTIDRTRDICDIDDQENITYEPFQETRAVFGIANARAVDLKIRRFKFAIYDQYGNREFRSRRIGTLGNQLLLANSEGEFETSFSYVSDGIKYLTGRGPVITDLSEGPKTIRIKLIGKSIQGTKIRAKVSTTLIFSNVNRCED